MRKKAVIFDMDGVIIDSQPLYHEFDVQMLRKFGHPATIETVIPYTGLTSVDRVTKYKKDFELSETVEDLIKLSVDAMRDFFTSGKIKLIDGIPELLSYLQKARVPIGIASSTSHELIELILQRLDVLRFFEKIISGEDVKAGKPAPDVYLRAAEVLKIQPFECIAIEDSLMGMRSAKAAGFTCIAYKNNYTLDYSCADIVVSDFYEVVPLMEELLLPDRAHRPQR